MSESAALAPPLIGHRQDARALAQNLVRIMDTLQLYQAEVARILGLHCAQVAALVQGRARLNPETPAWIKARRLEQVYAELHQRCGGDSMAMYRWLHLELAPLGATPHRLLVDEHALEAVLACLQGPRQ